jgi:hypothetical protein
LRQSAVPHVPDPADPVLVIVGQVSAIGPRLVLNAASTHLYSKHAKVRARQLANFPGNPGVNSIARNRSRFLFNRDDYT